MVTRVSFADCEDSVTEWENDAPHAGAWLEFR